MRRASGICRRGLRNSVHLPSQPPNRRPVGDTFVEADVAQQTERVLENLKAILTHAGLTLSHVVKTTVFLKDMNDFAAMNEVYAKYFPVAAPARSTVQAAGLPKDALVEIELVAAL